MLEKYKTIYSDDLKNKVIPFWVKNSPDFEFGGYFTCLDKNGAIYDDKKYMWLQAREVWMFSKLYNELGKKQEFLDLAKLGLDFIRKYGKDEKGRIYFSLTRDGKPYFFQRKPYAAVFYVLALIEYSKATGQAKYFEEAVELFWNIVKWIDDPALLDRPILPGYVPMSNLANVMVLASMAIELASVDKKYEYLDVMKKALACVKLHYNRLHNLLIENVPLGDIGSTNWPETRIFNPGHSIEVAWFILHLLKFVDDAEAEDLAYKVLRGSLEYGWDREYGGLYYFMDIENKPLLQLESSMKLWWPHSEAIYALVLAHTKTGDKIWLDWLDKVHQYTYLHFVDNEIGGWFGYCDRQGNLASTCKGGNYMGFFHVPRALLMSISI